jgi:hypothetical protein
MSALTVLIIRHAEKPRDAHAEKPRGAWPGPGLTEDGNPDKKSLVIRGWQRAGAWAALFGAGSGGDAFPAPAAIYAAKPGDDGAKEPSQRPFETVRPLAERLRLSPITKFAKGEETKLTAELAELTGVILVCWEHNSIIDPLLPALLGKQKSQLPGVPAKWDSDRFDVVLRLDRAVAGAPWSFRQQFPRLLSDDTDVPLS